MVNVQSKGRLLTKSKWLGITHLTVSCSVLDFSKYEKLKGLVKKEQGRGFDDIIVH